MRSPQRSVQAFVTDPPWRRNQPNPPACRACSTRPPAGAGELAGLDENLSIPEDELEDGTRCGTQPCEPRYQHHPKLVDIDHRRFDRHYYTPVLSRYSRHDRSITWLVPLPPPLCLSLTSEFHPLKPTASQAQASRLPAVRPSQAFAAVSYSSGYGNRRAMDWGLGSEHTLRIKRRVTVGGWHQRAKGEHTSRRASRCRLLSTRTVTQASGISDLLSHKTLRASVDHNPRSCA